ncbi:MAG: hypothetical protein AAFR58_10000 [Cyanobacteria bacterium J06627_28]
MKRFFLGLSAVVSSGLLWATAPIQPAQALCARPLERGQWVNQDSNTRGITRANIRFRCNDVIINDERPGAPYSIALFGSCSPTDCEWEEVGADRLSADEGRWLRTTLDQGFAERTIWVKAYSQNSLRVWIWTDFDDPNRADYASDEWFVRQ